MHEHGLLPGKALHGVRELNDFVAVHAAHPGVDVPAERSTGQRLCAHDRTQIRYVTKHFWQRYFSMHLFANWNP